VEYIGDIASTATLTSCEDKIPGMLTIRDLNLWKKNLGTIPVEIWEQIQVAMLILAENGWGMMPFLMRSISATFVPGQPIASRIERTLS